MSGSDVRGRWFAEVAALVLPVACTGCGASGRALCTLCRGRMLPSPRTRAVAGGALVVWSGLDYAGVPRSVLLAFKNGGRTDLATPLAAALLTAMSAALDAVPGDDITLVPMPATTRSSRERGYDPVRVLLRRARLPSASLLRLARRGADQAGLGRTDRFVNAAGSMRATRAASGRRVLLVDDVVTTGATLTEAASAIAAAGGTVLGAVTVASTPRLAPR